jgi:hypothetical protein
VGLYPSRPTQQVLWPPILKNVADDSTYGLLACNGSRHGGWPGPRSKEGLGCVVTYFVLVVFCSGESLDRGLAEDPTVKGKGKDGACMDYALALSSRLASNGIHGQLIFYRWHIRNTAIQGSHVFVVYRLSDESAWIVDNEIPHPKRVPREASPNAARFSAKRRPV